MQYEHVLQDLLPNIQQALETIPKLTVASFANVVANVVSPITAVPSTSVPFPGPQHSSDKHDSLLMASDDLQPGCLFYIWAYPYRHCYSLLAAVTSVLSRSCKSTKNPTLRTAIPHSQSQPAAHFLAGVLGNKGSG